MTSVFYDNHSAIIKISNSLSLLLAFLNQKDIHFLTCNNYRFNGIRQFIDIQYLNSLDTGNLVQVIIISNDVSISLSCQTYQLSIHTFQIIIIIIYNQNTILVAYLQIMHQIQTTTPFGTLHVVRRIRQLLQLLQHKIRHNHLSI